MQHEYELNDHEIWATQLGGQHTLRLTTRFVLPFQSNTSLLARIDGNGALYIRCATTGISLLFLPKLSVAARQIYALAQQHGVPLLLSDAQQSGSGLRTWQVPAA
jgi:hypothetical protein